MTEKSFLRILILSACLLLTAGYLRRASHPEVIPARASLRELPLTIGSWSGNDLPDYGEKVLAVLGVDDYVNRVYQDRSGAAAFLYAGYYNSQRQGDTIHSPLNCLPGSGWNPVRRGSVNLGSDTSPILVNRIAIAKGTDKQLVLYWYQSHGRVIASEYWGKIYTVLDAIRTGRTDAALVRVICPVPDLRPESERQSAETAAAFARTLIPLLPAYIPN